MDRHEKTDHIREIDACVVREALRQIIDVLVGRGYEPDRYTATINLLYPRDERGAYVGLNLKNGWAYLWKRVTDPFERQVVVEIFRYHKRARYSPKAKPVELTEYVLARSRKWNWYELSHDYGRWCEANGTCPFGPD
jgi:hypothetical protein